MPDQSNPRWRYHAPSPSSRAEHSWPLWTLVTNNPNPRSSARIKGMAENSAEPWFHVEVFHAVGVGSSGAANRPRASCSVNANDLAQAMAIGEQLYDAVVEILTVTQTIDADARIRLVLDEGQDES